MRDQRQRSTRAAPWPRPCGCSPPGARDRKSTRLNSSHLVISYAVFCLKKKNKYEVYDSLRHVQSQAIMYDILLTQCSVTSYLNITFPTYFPFSFSESYSHSIVSSTIH